MASSYDTSSSDPFKPIIVSDEQRSKLSLPKQNPDNVNYHLDLCTENDVQRLFEIFYKIIEDGQTYPQETIDYNQFRKYFLSHNCFVLRFKNDQQQIPVGGFYVKPNFPGRSSHLANYGLVLDLKYRGQGLANFLVSECIRLARLLGFKALYTNLVYCNNIASIKTCKRYGFKQVGLLPKAGLLKNLGYVDAIQFYKDLEQEDLIAKS